jgi:hypothetical protein
MIVQALCQQNLQYRAQSEADGDHDSGFPEEITRGELAVSVLVGRTLHGERTELIALHDIRVFHAGLLTAGQFTPRPL